VFFIFTFNSDYLNKNYFQVKFDHLLFGSFLLRDYSISCQSAVSPLFMRVYYKLGGFWELAFKFYLTESPVAWGFLVLNYFLSSH